jgi:hypothetical protein
MQQAFNRQMQGNYIHADYSMPLCICTGADIAAILHITTNDSMLSAAAEYLNTLFRSAFLLVGRMHNKDI